MELLNQVPEYFGRMIGSLDLERGSCACFRRIPLMTSFNTHRAPVATRLVQKGDSGQVNPDGRQAEVGAEVGREQGYMTPGGWDCGHV